MPSTSELSRLTSHFEDLLHFRAVVEAGSFNRASRAVGLSQPALTRSVGRLERALGIPLLNRTAKGVFPTPYGESLLNHIRLIDSELQRAAATIEVQKTGTGGHLRCGGSTVALSSIVPAAVDAFQKTRPGITVTIVQGVVKDMLKMASLGELDLVICMQQKRGMDAEFEMTPLGYDRMGAFARRDHPVFRQPMPSLKALAANYRWVLPQPSGDIFQSIRKEFLRHKSALPLVAVETADVTSIRWLVQNSDRIAITHSQVFEAGLRAGTVRLLQGNWRFPQHKAVIYCKKGEITPAVAAFITCLKSIAAVMPLEPHQASLELP